MSMLLDLRMRVRLRAARRGQNCCPSCDTPGRCTEDQCKARRPLCHQGCGRRTCIQARLNGCRPTCLDCYFEKRIVARIDPEIGIWVERRDGVLGLVVGAPREVLGCHAIEVRNGPNSSIMTSAEGFWRQWQRAEALIGMEQRIAQIGPSLAYHFT